MSNSKTDKLRKQLKLAQRRRNRRPTPSASIPVALKANGGLERRMVRDHQDVLRSIETTLVGASRDADDVDDRVVEKTLRLAIGRQAFSEDPIVAWVLNLLGEMRESRDDTSDDTWRDALRVVYASLKRHSRCQPGEFSYLRFVGSYIA